MVTRRWHGKLVTTCLFMRERGKHSSCQYAANRCLFSPQGSDQVSHRLPVLSTSFPLSHQNVAPEHLRGKSEQFKKKKKKKREVWLSNVDIFVIRSRFICSPNIWIFSRFLKVTACLNMLVYCLMSLERGCVHLHPSSTSGRPTERWAAIGEVEPHTERQVHVRLWNNSRKKKDDDLQFFFLFSGL